MIAMLKMFLIQCMYSMWYWCAVPASFLCLPNAFEVSKSPHIYISQLTHNLFYQTYKPMKIIGNLFYSLSTSAQTVVVEDFLSAMNSLTPPCSLCCTSSRCNAGSLPAQSSVVVLENAGCTVKVGVLTVFVVSSTIMWLLSVLMQ